MSFKRSREKIEFATHRVVLSETVPCDNQQRRQHSATGFEACTQCSQMALHIKCGFAGGTQRSANRSNGTGRVIRQLFHYHLEA